MCFSENMGAKIPHNFKIMTLKIVSTYSYSYSLGLFFKNDNDLRISPHPGLELSGGWGPSSCLQTLIFE